VLEANQIWKQNRSNIFGRKLTEFNCYTKKVPLLTAYTRPLNIKQLDVNRK